MSYRFRHVALGAAALTPFAGWSTDTKAQSYTVQNISVSGSAGTFTAGTSTVTLTLSPSGSFSPSGYQRTATAPTYTVTVKCVDGNTGGKSCASNSMVLVIKDTAAASGRLGALQDFTIGSNTQSLLSGPSGSNPTTFTLGSLTNSATATFRVGFSTPVLTTGSTGVATTRTFTVGLGLSTSSITSSMTSTMAPIIWNPMAIGVTGSLDFGKLVKPTSGTGSFTLSPSGALSASGGAAVIPGNGHSVPTFTVTGEGHQAFSLSVPSSFLMTLGGTDTLTVNTTTSFSGVTQTLSSALGSQGSFPFTVGGILPVSSTTPSGAYTGNLVVGVQYN